MLKIGHPLSEIPNIEGFRFRGISHEGDMIPCILVKEKNLHVVFDEYNNIPVFHILRGWMQYANKTL